MPLPLWGRAGGITRATTWVWRRRFPVRRWRRTAVGWREASRHSWWRELKRWKVTHSPDIPEGNEQRLFSMGGRVLQFTLWWRKRKW